MTREEAIKYMEVFNGLLIPEEAHQALDMAIEALSAKRPKGRWIEEGLVMWKCSECGLLSFSDSHFCSDCGADMRNNEEQDV